MTDREQQGTDDGRLTRRRFVVAASGAVAAAGLHGVPALAKPASRGEREPFAVVADSHLDPFSPDHSDNMRAVFDHILARSERPAFVEHVGDVVEIGFPEEYAEWRRVRPDALVDLIRAVPGNHEVRWDEFAKELYFAEFEQTPYSFDAAGVHVVALDPTQLLQEPGFFSRAQLEWLREDLKRAGQDVPSVVFVHYPMSGDYLYVGNQEEFLRAVEGFDVRAVVAGHIHRQEVMRVNGITSVTLPGILNTAAYHWVTPVTGADGAPALAITLAQRGAAGWQETPVVEIPVEGERRALRRAPKLRTEVAGDRSSVEVVADLHPAQDADAAGARFVPESVFGGRSSAGWTALAPEQGGRRWRGTVDASALAAGLHELQVQASDGDARFEATEAVELPATATDRLRLAWGKDLVTAIQAGLAPLPDDRLVAATVGGAVVALDAGGSQPSERWRREAAGPVYGTPATDPEGRRVFVPTATGVVHAFDAADGREAWRFTVPRPALAAPATTADGTVLIAAAGRALHALEADSGDERWTADVGGFVGGRPAADERAVYAGAGDGKVHAFSLATGERLWERVLSSGAPYRTFILGPWATQPTLLPGDRVLVATVLNAYALDRSTGATAWELRGGFMYNAALLLADRLVMVDEFGGVVAVDPLTGAELWRTKLAQRVLGGSPALWKGAVAIGGVNGLVALLDPATGADAGRLRIGVDYVHSAPAVAGDVLAVGSQDGRLRAVMALPSA